MVKPWREVVRPHRDVVDGVFRQSEFSADLSMVAEGNASPEYQDAEKFFARTFITEGIKDLLVSVTERLCGRGGEPVIELQTNFGGGKTHTLLAVYHLARHACRAADLQGVAEVLTAAGVDDIPPAKVAVIDGNVLAPNQPIEKDGLAIRTLWGFIAYQLMGREGYARVAASDESGTSPGKEVIKELLTAAGPCVILLDELVAYYRQFNTTRTLTGGTFESNISFLQALTESVKAVPTAILLASLPSSDTEAAGSFGLQVMQTVDKTFGRLNSIWKPVSTEEGFEIVKRRLFEPIADEAAVDETCRAFARLYEANVRKLPVELRNGSWQEEMKRCYPIHPEVFERLYRDWSTLPSFQKTRGVLQYMAIVINRLWINGTDEPLIMPGSIPLGDASVANKSTQYLPNGWQPVIEAEIDGTRSIPVAIDESDPRLSPIHAAVRVARTVFLGSAPGSTQQAVRGIDIQHILLGCLLPDQDPSFYEDALRKMRERQHYLFCQDDNFWFDTRPTLKRTMETFKERCTAQQINEILTTTLRAKWGSPSVIASLHVFPTSQDVPDDIVSGLRLAVLPLDVAYSQAGAVRTFDAARVILDQHGTSPRLRKNRVVFLAAELASIARLQDCCKTLLAWREIKDAINGGGINATMNDAAQVAAEISQTQRLLEGTVLESFRCLLVPIAETASIIGFDVRKLQVTNGLLGQTVENVLLSNDDVVRTWSPMFLKTVLERDYFKGTVTEVSTRKLWTDMASYCQYQRLCSADTIIATISQGVTDRDFFGFARGKSDDGKYLGFKFGEPVTAVEISNNDLLIKADAAAAYASAANAAEGDGGGNSDGASGSVTGVAPTANGSTAGNNSNSPRGGNIGGVIPSAAKRAYVGMVSIDASHDTNALQQVIEEVVSHLSRTGARVRVRLEIEARDQNPFSPATVRTVSENARALNFDRTDFS